MPDDILTALGRRLRDQEHMHPSVLPFGTDICTKSKILHISGTEGLGRQERGSMATHPVHQFGLTCLPEATSNIRRRK